MIEYIISTTITEYNKKVAINMNKGNAILYGDEGCAARASVKETGNIRKN